MYDDEDEYLDRYGDGDRNKTNMYILILIKKLDIIYTYIRTQSITVEISHQNLNEFK